MNTIKQNDYKFNIILKYANLYCPNKANSLHSNYYYLSNIITVLSEIVTWKNLKISINYKNIKKYYYKTINTIYLFIME